MKLYLLSLTLFLAAVSVIQAFADETVKDKVEEAGHDTKRAGKSVIRDVNEKACPLVNGKVECAVNKVKHTGQKVGDKVEDAVD